MCTPAPVHFRWNPAVPVHQRSYVLAPDPVCSSSPLSRPIFAYQKGPLTFGSLL